MQLVQNWREVLKRAWVMWVLYGMLVVQIIGIAQGVLNSDTASGLPVGMKDAALVVLNVVGIWVRVLHQISVQVPPTADKPKG